MPSKNLHFLWVTVNKQNAKSKIYSMLVSIKYQGEKVKHTLGKRDVKRCKLGGVEIFHSMEGFPEKVTFQYIWAFVSPSIISLTFAPQDCCWESHRFVSRKYM